MYCSKRANNRLHLLAAVMAGVLLWLAHPGAATAADNSYLDALKAEASSDSKPREGTTVSAEDGRTDDQEQMEEWMRTEFMGSYVFYQKLSETKKKVIYRAYRAGAPITELREKINQLLKQ